MAPSSGLIRIFIMIIDHQQGEGGHGVATFIGERATFIGKNTPFDPYSEYESTRPRVKKKDWTD